MIKKIPSFDSPIVLGIKSVGVGQKGSRDMSHQEVESLIEDFKNNIPTRSQIGAFFAGLYHKGIGENEKKLAVIFPSLILFKPEKVFNYFVSKDVPSSIKKIGKKLFNKNELTYKEAFEIGKYIFKQNADDFVCGLVASALRVRYETDDEYKGLLTAMQETVGDNFKGPIEKGPPIIQLAEPFDGVNRSYLLTPIIADKLKQLGYRVIVLMGQSSGPKYGLTVEDLIEKLNLSKIKNREEISNLPEVFYLDQKDLSKALDRWVSIRREIIKRPFLATLEKFINPFNADISLTSAFHGPYSEKMVTIGENAGFPIVIVLRRGPEGTLSFSSHHSTIINISKKEISTNNGYERSKILHGPKEAGIKPEQDVKIDISLEQNVKIIKNYFAKGNTGINFLDNKIAITMGGIKLALNSNSAPQ